MSRNFSFAAASSSATFAAWALAFASFSAFSRAISWRFFSARAACAASSRSRLSVDSTVFFPLFEMKLFDFCEFLTSSDDLRTSSDDVSAFDMSTTSFAFA